MNDFIFWVASVTFLFGDGQNKLIGYLKPYTWQANYCLKVKCVVNGFF
jgi:hypothetical protein